MMPMASAVIRACTRHAARLYDRFRLDHVVGYFDVDQAPWGARLARFVRRPISTCAARSSSAILRQAEERTSWPRTWASSSVRAIPADLKVPGTRDSERDEAQSFRDPHASRP
jgi:hypothetical protein